MDFFTVKMEFEYYNLYKIHDQRVLFQMCIWISDLFHYNKSIHSERHAISLVSKKKLTGPQHVFDTRKMQTAQPAAGVPAAQHTFTVKYIWALFYSLMMSVDAAGGGGGGGIMHRIK